MRKQSLHLVTVCFLATALSGQGFCEIKETKEQGTAVPAPLSKPIFQPFTGKITKNKVRLRTQPSLDAPILRELNRGDLLVIVGEQDDFLVVQPLPDTKAYVFRTFVLDNVVEGSKVNMRTEPDIDAPIIGQLNAGDKIQGSISPLNNKWLEITTPASIRFYIAKDYVEKIGDPQMMATVERRKKEIYQLINSAKQASVLELEKPFDEIRLEPIFSSLNKTINQYADFPDQIAVAKEIQKNMQDSYLEKKIRFLETKTKMTTETLQAKNQQLTTEMKLQQEKLSEMQQKLLEQQTSAPPILTTSSIVDPVTPKMALWNDSEETLYIKWIEEHPQGSMEEFYGHQKENSIVLKGIIEAYHRPVKNKPGDFLLISRANNLPIAYLYSTKINLQEKIGQEHSLVVTPRSNNNFAFPAYFVLSIE